MQSALSNSLTLCKTTAGGDASSCSAAEYNVYIQRDAALGCVTLYNNEGMHLKIIIIRAMWRKLIKDCTQWRIVRRPRR